MKHSKTAAVRGKHVPQRSCLSCRQVKDKHEMIRLVYTPDGNLEVDLNGRKAGRGAYICPSQRCWEAGLKGNRVEHALRRQLTPVDRERLEAYAREKFEGADSGQGE
jgi:predicted RNA-binding protein YlxR (DUF448 family)